MSADESNVDRVLPLALLVLSLLPVSVATQTPPQPREEERGVSGYVLAPDGLPITGGTVWIRPPGIPATTSIGSTGRFRVVPRAAGLHELFINVPGLAPYRVKVTVPTSRTLALPVIRLSPATYFRVRFISATGDVLLSPRLIRQFLDSRGEPIPGASERADQVDADGATTIGPLPRGVMTLALDSPPLAKTRLPDVWVMGDTTLIDGGTVTVQPGAVLEVDVVDAAGAPVPRHDVSLEDTAPLSPLTFAPVKTDREGRATFDRLGAGRYRVRTQALGRCDVRPLMIERTVTVPRAGSARTRIVADGTAFLRFISPLGPLRGNTISALPESTTPTTATTSSRPPFPFVVSPDGRVFRLSTFDMPCRATTDADGRVTLNHFPPGPTRIEVRQLNSTWIRTVTVPPEGRELTIEIPTGYLPVRVLDGRTGGRVAGAMVTWTAGRARVEAAASASGEALLEGVARLPGTLAIRSDRHEPSEVKLQEPPDVLYEVTLVPLPPPAGAASLLARVTTALREPLPNAVVELTPEDPLEVGHVAVTEAKGFVLFTPPPFGALRLTAAADGFVPAATRISEQAIGDIGVALSRGYRVIGGVEPSIGAGRHVIRIVNAAGASMDHLLDAASDRSITPPARLSLGPLAPGTYVVELHGPRGQWQAKVQIVDRNVPVTFQ